MCIINIAIRIRAFNAESAPTEESISNTVSNYVVVRFQALSFRIKGVKHCSVAFN